MEGVSYYFRAVFSDELLIGIGLDRCSLSWRWSFFFFCNGPAGSMDSSNRVRSDRFHPPADTVTLSLLALSAFEAGGILSAKSPGKYKRFYVHWVHSESTESSVCGTGDESAILLERAAKRIRLGELDCRYMFRQLIVHVFPDPVFWGG